MVKRTAKTADIKTKDQQTDSTQSMSFIDRISTILLSLSAGKTSVKDVAQWCNLNISTTHRLLSMLKDPGLTMYDPHTHRYFLGPLINQLASNPDTAHQFLLTSSTDEVRRLADYTGETVNFGCLFGLQIESLIEIPSKYSLKVFISEDDEKRHHSLTPFGASERALLSQLNELLLNKVLNSIKIISDPLIDIEKIKPQLKRIREQGFEISYGERVPDTVAISAPILGYTTPLCLTIIGPETRIKDNVSGFTSQLLNSVNRLALNIKEFFKYNKPN